MKKQIRKLIRHLFGGQNLSTELVLESGTAKVAVEALTIDEIEKHLPADVTWGTLIHAHEVMRALPGGPSSYYLTRLALYLREHRKGSTEWSSEESIRQAALDWVAERAA